MRGKLRQGELAGAMAVTAGALPPGLTVGGQGSLAGVPAAPGTFTATLSATDSKGVAASRQ